MKLNPTDLITRAWVQALIVLAVVVPLMRLLPANAGPLGATAAVLFTVACAVGLVFRPSYLPALSSLLASWIIVLGVLIRVAVHFAGNDGALYFGPAFALVLPAVAIASWVHRRRVRRAEAFPP